MKDGETEEAALERLSAIITEMEKKYAGFAKRILYQRSPRAIVI